MEIYFVVRWLTFGFPDSISPEVNVNVPCFSSITNIEKIIRVDVIDNLPQSAIGRSDALLK
jgi:hypothetical protein